MARALKKAPPAVSAPRPVKVIPKEKFEQAQQKVMKKFAKTFAALAK